MINESKEFAINKINLFKDKINEYIIENKIELKFKNNNIPFQLYESKNLFPICLSGYYENSKIVVYGTPKINNNSIIINMNNKEAYYVIDTKNTEIKITYEDKEYVKKATMISIDKNVKEVEVIKAGKRYFLLKE